MQMTTGAEMTKRTEAEDRVARCEAIVSRRALQLENAAQLVTDLQRQLDSALEMLQSAEADLAKTRRTA